VVVGQAYEPGWIGSNDTYIAPTSTNLACTRDATWTASVGSNENLPIDCVNWYEAYAFCIWDGGFLPSETEAEYAAAGGSQQREYPWGSTDPGTANQYAIYGCYYPNGSGCTLTFANIAPVGTATLGVGLWGQLDLAGNIVEWTLDAYGPYLDPCVDCADLYNLSGQQACGGSNFQASASQLLPTASGSFEPVGRGVEGIGFRCARTP